MDYFYIFVALFASQSHFLVSAEMKFGCLFQSELCTQYEICFNDGVFGRCHTVPVTEVYTNNVSPSMVQRFRTMLQKMSNRGLTLEDNITQQELSQELSKMKRIPYRQFDSGPGPGYNTKTRLPFDLMDASDRSVKPVEMESSRNLQRYLHSLGILPHSLYSVGPKITSKERTSATTRHGTGINGDLLVDSLRQILSGQVISQKGRTSQDNDLQSYPPLWPADRKTLKSSTLEDGSKSSIIPKTGRDQSASSMDQLSHLDGRLIQNMGQHNVDHPVPQDLGQLYRVIANAVQVVDREQVHNQVTPEPRDFKMKKGPEEQNQRGEKVMSGHQLSPMKPQESTAVVEAVVQDQQRETDKHPESSEKVKNGLLAKLLAYLDKTSFTTSNNKDSKGPKVGLENVQSRTTQAEVTVQKKDTTQSVEEVSEVHGWIKEVVPPPAAVVLEHPQRKVQGEELQMDVKADPMKANKDVYGYIITDTDALQTDEGLHLMKILARRAKIQMIDFLELSVVGPAVTFKVGPNAQNITTADVANVAVQNKLELEKEAKVIILEAGVTDGTKINQIPTKYSQTESTKFLILTVISILCIVGVLLVSTVVYCLRNRSHHKLREKLTNLGTEVGSDATSTYQELCRQRMAVNPSVERPEPLSSRIDSVSSQFSDCAGPVVSPSARSSTSSWFEEPAHYNLDISTGHMILSYMEDHLKNKDRLKKEWEAMCAYQAEPNASTIGKKDGNSKKNRSNAVVAYDHSRIHLKVENSQGNSDYINASPIMDHDPRNPAYISTQGPLPSTVADFWQMVWENGCVVIVMLAPLTESGVKQCYHYWPDEGSNLYHIYEVNLVSEHIWCDDFLVRSFYLKNMQTNETRTVTQFHFLTWLNQSVPESSRTLLDFRRKVNKCYRGRSCPIIVHCSDGSGRSGTYILIDMVLNKMAKGAKEIDIAATLEHLRDQRPGMVQTKEQFEFALTAVAEEVNGILKALPQ